MIYKLTIEDELKRNQRLIPNKESANIISRFARDLKLEGLSDHRVIFYIIRLRKISRLMENNFLNPSLEDIKDLIAALSSDKKIGPRTVEDHKQAIRRFYQWKMTENEFETTLSWMKIKTNVNRLKKSEDLITKAELNKLVENAMNPRDRALFSLMYDSGCRIGEILTLRIKDLAFDQFGAMIHVSGKTGERKVRIVGDSISYLREWISSHPGRNDPESWVFIGIAKPIRGNQMTYDELRSALQKSKKRAGIKKRVHPHLFRHTRASLLASKVAEAPLEAQMGWIHGSRQTRTYVHLSGRDQDNAILKAYGIEIKEDGAISEEMPKSCARCGELNPSNSAYCRKCWLPFDIKLALDQEEKVNTMVNALVNSSSIDTLTKGLLNTIPEDLKVKLIESVLQSIVNSPEIKDKLKGEVK